VFTVTAVVAFAVNRFWSDEKLVLGYSIYGSLLVFGIVIPSLLVQVAHRDARFPSVWIPVAVLRDRFPVTPYLLVGGLAILVIHLALYPWPDITRESTSYAGLSARAAQSKAVKRIRDLRADLPALRYSTQTRGVADGKDAWLVFFHSRQRIWRSALLRMRCGGQGRRCNSFCGMFEVAKHRGASVQQTV
jgi:hypothetical protein